MVIILLHATLAKTILYFMFVCGLWGTISAFRGGLNGNFAGALVIGEGLIVCQALLGVISFFVAPTGRPTGSLHYLYGISTLVTLPGIYSFTRNRPPSIQALWFGGGAFFILGLAIRGIQTAHGT